MPLESSGEGVDPTGTFAVWLWASVSLCLSLRDLICERG